MRQSFGFKTDIFNNKMLVSNTAMETYSFAFPFSFLPPLAIAVHFTKYNQKKKGFLRELPLFLFFFFFCSLYLEKTYEIIILSLHHVFFFFLFLKKCILDQYD